MKKRAKQPVMAVQLQRKHLDMIKYFADDEDKRYAASRLHVYRSGEACSAQATDGGLAAALPTQFVNADELPTGLPGSSLVDGAVATIDSETVKKVLRLLPKRGMEIFQHAYLTVDGKTTCLTVFTLTANVFRVPATDKSPVPNIPESDIQPPGPLRLRLSARRLANVAAFLDRHTQGYLTFDFSAAHDSALTRIEGDGDFLAVLAPVRTMAVKVDGSPEPGAHPETWRAAVSAAARAEKKLEANHEA